MAYLNILKKDFRDHERDAPFQSANFRVPDDAPPMYVTTLEMALVYNVRIIGRKGALRGCVCTRTRLSVRSACARSLVSTSSRDFLGLRCERAQWIPQFYGL